ncbi:MAG: hypothetical protein WDO15_29780 [Bacteroidota bacterium]
MTRLIDDLLIFSRLSQADILVESVDLNSLLSQIVSDLEITIVIRMPRFVSINFRL